LLGGEIEFIRREWLRYHPFIAMPHTLWNPRQHYGYLRTYPTSGPGTLLWHETHHTVISYFGHRPQEVPSSSPGECKRYRHSFVFLIFPDDCPELDVEVFVEHLGYNTDSYGESGFACAGGTLSKSGFDPDIPINGCSGYRGI
jgi:hypothetical protein